MDDDDGEGSRKLMPPPTNGWREDFARIAETVARLEASVLETASNAEAHVKRTASHIAEKLAVSDRVTVEWRTNLERRMTASAERLDKLETRAEEMEGALSVNTDLTKRSVDASERTLTELREFVTFAHRTRATARFLAWLVKWFAGAINRVAKWAVPIVALAAAIWAWLHGAK